MWVYSGRRGVHCWVCDDHARALSNDGRSAVVEYLSIARVRYLYIYIIDTARKRDVCLFHVCIIGKHGICFLIVCCVNLYICV